jgi:bacterioferritin
MQPQTQLDPRALYDVEQVRREAARSIQSGAVTEGYPFDLARTHELLNEALASEILCVLRYRHHQIVAKGIDFPQVAAEFAEHAASEERHMMAIAERIDELGGDPDLNPATVAKRAATEFGHSQSLTEMIQDDLVAERVVIEIYRRMVAWFGNADPTTRRLLEGILADEENHANELAALLTSVDENPASSPATGHTNGRGDGAP